MPCDGPLIWDHLCVRGFGESWELGRALGKKVLLSCFVAVITPADNPWVAALEILHRTLMHAAWRQDSEPNHLRK